MSDEGGQQGPATPFAPFCRRGRPAIPQSQALKARQVRCDVRARCRRSAAPVQLLWCAQARCCARELAATCHSAAVPTAACSSRISARLLRHMDAKVKICPQEKSSSNRRPRGGGRKAWRQPQELEESERHGEMAGASHIAGEDRSAGPRRFPTGGGFEAPSRETLVWRRTGSSHCRRVRSRPTARALRPDHADGSHAEGNGSRAQLGRPPSLKRSTPIVRILFWIERCAASLGITLLPPHAVHRPRRGALTVRHP